MRLWSIHPRYLDPQGLVALWRESLLAQKVLRGETRGYRNHPQLIRFKNTANPAGAIAAYLKYIVAEAESRGYNFDRSKIANEHFNGRIPVTSGQVEYEFRHLLGKLKRRSPELYGQTKRVQPIEIHPLLEQVEGAVEDWEII